MDNIHYQPAKIEDDLMLVREARDYSHPDMYLNDEDDYCDPDDLDP